MLPDNDTLKALLIASTPGPWQKVAADHPMWEGDETPPFDVVGADGKIIANNAAFYPEAVSPENGVLIALTPGLVAEVIRLRERLATVEGERDEARRELTELSRSNAEMMARIGQLESERSAKPFPLTPAEKLAQWKAAKALVGSPLKIVVETVTGRGDGKTYRWTSCDGTNMMSLIVPVGTTAEDETLRVAECRDALIAAGWDLVGGAL